MSDRQSLRGESSGKIQKPETFLNKCSVGSSFLSYLLLADRSCMVGNNIDHTPSSNRESNNGSHASREPGKQAAG